MSKKDIADKVNEMRTNAPHRGATQDTASMYNSLSISHTQAAQPTTEDEINKVIHEIIRSYKANYPTRTSILLSEMIQYFKATTPRGWTVDLMAKYGTLRNYIASRNTIFDFDSRQVALKIDKDVPTQDITSKKANKTAQKSQDRPEVPPTTDSIDKHTKPGQPSPQDDSQVKSGQATLAYMDESDASSDDDDSGDSEPWAQRPHMRGRPTQKRSETEAERREKMKNRGCAPEANTYGLTLPATILFLSLTLLFIFGYCIHTGIVHVEPYSPVNNGIAARFLNNYKKFIANILDDSSLSPH